MAAGARRPILSRLLALLQLPACAPCWAIQLPPVSGSPVPREEAGGPARVVLSPREVEVALERLDAEAEADAGRMDAEKRLERLDAEAEARLERMQAKAELERLDAEAEARLEKLNAGPELGPDAEGGGARRLFAVGAGRTHKLPDQGRAGGPPNSPEEAMGEGAGDERPAELSDPVEEAAREDADGGARKSPEEALPEEETDWRATHAEEADRGPPEPLQEEKRATEPTESPEGATTEDEEEEEVDNGHARLMAGAVHFAGADRVFDKSPEGDTGGPSLPGEAMHQEEDVRATARPASAMEVEG